MLTERASGMMFGLLVHMAARDGDGMLTAVEPSVLLMSILAGAAQNEIGRRKLSAG